VAALAGEQIRRVRLEDGEATVDEPMFEGPSDASARWWRARTVPSTRLRATATAAARHARVTPDSPDRATAYRGGSLRSAVLVFAAVGREPKTCLSSDAGGSFMPHTVRKRGDKYEIVKKLSGGRTQKVGESDSRKKAEASARIRDQRSSD
jgi:hypothetical protein